jgi:protein TonB
MMRRPDDTLSLALCASLIVHVAIMFAAFETQVVELSDDLHHPGWSPEELRQLALATQPAEQPPIIQPPPTEWGESAGKGIAITSAPGDQPLSAPKGPEDQSFASRDPAGPAKQFPEEPSMSTAASGQGGDGKPRLLDALAERHAKPVPPIVIPQSPQPLSPPERQIAVQPNHAGFGAESDDPDKSSTRNTREPTPVTTAPSKVLVLNTPTPNTPKPSDSNPPEHASSNSTAGAPGPPTAAADPAADTGLESDPFSKTPGVEFRNGKVEARSGRQVKPVRPRLTEASRRDLLSLRFPTILLKVRIDDTGKVQDVRVLRGSGSEAIDMPVYRAMWQWWFEPPKDKEGKPLPDVQLVAIHWG